ncbi:MAG: VOC family protein [gamma proteobacterium symbiont of Bathyaustriella thionipta]|nr:VOC family protein [gamma proteobacterium symbiont of Bathyaustriella thionipta]
MNKPAKTLGMSHVALYVQDLAACEAFYCDLLGMQVEWRPDAENVYLTSGKDNLALHHQPAMQPDESRQRLDHIGFFIRSPAEVDDWFAYLQQQGVAMRAAPRTHRDGARSFYCQDPDGTSVQIIYHPPVSG